MGLSEDSLRRVQEVVALTCGPQPALRVTHSLGEFVCSESHPMVAQGGAAIPARCLAPGEDLLTAEDGSPVEILRIVAVGEVEVYGWTCVPDHTFLSGGLLHHNKIMSTSAQSVQSTQT